jgi:serine/threonine-protein kinase
MSDPANLVLWRDLRGLFPGDAAATRSHLVLPDSLFRTSAAAPAARSSLAPRSTNRPGLSRVSQGVPARASRPGRADETLRRGAIIDKYRIDRLLGRGGFAAVYRATHLLLHSQVAIKLLRPSALARHPQLAQLLCDEARFAARIDHPNVVRVHDVTHTPGITYIVMEYIEGRSLAETIKRSGQLPPARVLEVGAGVVAGLKTALAAGLIHRDIKPANVLLGRRGEIKIVDLGLVRRTDADDQPDAPAPDGRRATIGTYGYMAPEQADDPERIDFRADIYSLGVTLYEAAVGAPPFPLGDPATCLEMHASYPVPPPHERSPGIPPALSELLLRMLAKHPDGRFSSYDSLAKAIEHAATTIGR